ncbi:MAG: rhomboid family intramembrane serine protease [Acidimicrobiales bacterium]
MSTQMQTCYRHGDRRAGVVCQRCDRPICPDCMRQASVGFHCPECTKQGAQKVVRAGQLRTRPIVTQVLIGINVAVFVAGVGSGLQTRSQVALDYALTADFGFPLSGLGVANGEWYRLVTAGFLHVNIIHIALNMLALYQLGMLLEPAFGKLRFGLVYAVSLLTGSLGVMLVSPSGLTMGASGAVFGLMGFAFMALRARGVDPFSTGLGGTIMLNLLITFTLSRYISVGGHIGGLIGGALCGWILTDLGPRYLKDEGVVLGAIVTLGLVVTASAVLVAQ